MKFLNVMGIALVVLIASPALADKDSEEKKREDIERCEQAKEQMGSFEGMPEMTCEEIVAASEERK